MAVTGRCNWIIITQLLGEARCTLTPEHHGDHSFALDQLSISLFASHTYHPQDGAIDGPKS
jgi:hypothetical protein